MKTNQKFSSGSEKVYDANSGLSSYSISEAIVGFIKITVTPFIISVVLSLLTLFKSDKWNLILIRARDEFIQVTGLKLSFYIIIILVGVSFIVYSFDFLTKFLARFIYLISNVGFVINAVLAGIFTGIMFSEVFDVENNISPSFKFEFYIIVFGISVIFYGSTKVLPYIIKKDIDEILGRSRWFLPLIFGLFLTAFGICALDNEEWCEIPENQNTAACKATN